MTQTDGNISASANGTATIAGGGVGVVFGSNHTVTQTGGNISASANGIEPIAVGGGMGFIRGSGHTVTQTGVQVILQGVTTGAAFGEIGSQTNIRLQLFSGNASGHPVYGRLNFGSIVTGFVDIAGYNAEIPQNDRYDRDHIDYLNTTNPADWREGHRAKCGDSASDTNPKFNTTCHYPHEELLTAVNSHEFNESAWLVTRQRYPFKPQSNPAGLVRISHLNLNGTEIREDKSFGTDSTHLLSPILSQISLPEGQPAAALAIGQNELAAIYPHTNHQAVLLARFPLGSEEDNYHVDEVTGVIGRPVLLLNPDSSQGCYGFLTWDQNDNSQIVRRYVWNTFNQPEVEEYDLDWLSSDTDYPVIGLGYENQWLYVARRFGENVTLERIDLLDGQQDSEGAILKNVPAEVTGREELNFIIKPYGNGRVAMIPRHTVLAEDRDGQVKGLSVSWSKYGGEADWTISNGTAFNVSISPTTPVESISPTTPVESISPTTPVESIRPTPPVDVCIRPTPPVKSIRPTPSVNNIRPTPPVESIRPTPPVDVSIRPTAPPITGKPDIIPTVTDGVAACVFCGAVGAGVAVCVCCKKKINHQKNKHKHKRRRNAQAADPLQYETPIQPLIYDDTRHSDQSAGQRGDGT